MHPYPSFIRHIENSDPLFPQIKLLHNQLLNFFLGTKSPTRVGSLIALPISQFQPEYSKILGSAGGHVPRFGTGGNGIAHTRGKDYATNDG